MSSIKKRIKADAIELLDARRIRGARKVEIRKFEDPRRKAIYETVSLSADQEQSIDEIYITNYGEKIPYTWHRHFTAYTGKFDKYFFPELLYIPEYERFMNLNLFHSKTFEDKNALRLLALAADVRMPETVFSNVGGVLQNHNREFVSIEEIMKIDGEFFVKPTVGTASGEGCQVISAKNGYDEISGLGIKSILDSKGNNWAIQERIHCHKQISDIYPNSVNTFRIMTYIWKDDIYHVPVIMRIGQGGANVDNAHAGGMFIALDDDGTLHEKAFTEFKKEFTEHPDTKLKFKGYNIELFSKVLDAAIRAHSYIPQIGNINWDFTIDMEGNPVLIEANIIGGGIWLFEMAHGCGIFGERTPEILRWVRVMKDLRTTERARFMFGKNFE